MKKRRYLLVDSSVLPDYFEKVIEAKALLASGKETNVSVAARAVGISRSTFYKYKDFVFPQEGEQSRRKAFLSFMLLHKSGILGEVLSTLSAYGTNILTLSQSMPIHDTAHVTLSLELPPNAPDAQDLITILDGVNGVSGARLIAIE
ncbi:MAG: ACT domain-containing protein [Clostridia bacterium]|nr:ACT domain-containing protein [Clostridia bacterium]